MAKLRFTALRSHKFAAKESSLPLTPKRFYLAGIDDYQITNACLGTDYLSDRPMTSISSDIF